MRLLCIIDLLKPLVLYFLNGRMAFNVCVILQGYFFQVQVVLILTVLLLEILIFAFYLLKGLLIGLSLIFFRMSIISQSIYLVLEYLNSFLEFFYLILKVLSHFFEFMLVFRPNLTFIDIVANCYFLD